MNAARETAKETAKDLVCYLMSCFELEKKPEDAYKPRELLYMCLKSVQSLSDEAFEDAFYDGLQLFALEMISSKTQN